MLVTQSVAIAKVHRRNGFDVTKDGYEFNVALMAIAAGLLLRKSAGWRLPGEILTAPDPAGHGGYESEWPAFTAARGEEDQSTSAT